MFGGSFFLAPGLELREFNVFEAESKENERGRVTINSLKPIGTIKAILAQAKPDERERWHQLGHPITHKIIQQGVSVFEIRSGDVFDYNRRKFYNQGSPNNLGDLGHWTIYYCEERSDIT